MSIISDLIATDSIIHDLIESLLIFVISISYFILLVD